jgi:hypothetical protein
LIRHDSVQRQHRMHSLAFGIELATDE